MRLFIAIIISFFILTACSSQPQVTVTSFAEETVTLPPPTLTATPTLAPTATSTITPSPTFNPETWAGTDQVRLDHNAKMREWGLDPADYPCDEVGVCRDKEGKIISENEKYDLHFLQQLLATSETLKSTNYKPKTGNVPEGSNLATDDVGINYLLPLHARWRKEYIKLHGVDPYVKGSSFYDGFLINPRTLSWGSVWTQKKDGETEWRELIWETKEDEVQSVRIIPAISVQTYWMNQ